MTGKHFEIQGDDPEQKGQQCLDEAACFPHKIRTIFKSAEKAKSRVSTPSSVRMVERLSCLSIVGQTKRIIRFLTPEYLKSWGQYP